MCEIGARHAVSYVPLRKGQKLPRWENRETACLAPISPQPERTAGELAVIQACRFVHQREAVG